MKGSRGGGEEGEIEERVRRLVASRQGTGGEDWGDGEMGIGG